METPLSIAPPPAAVADTPPWDIEAAETAAPLREPARKALPMAAANIEAERIPWGVAALTFATALLVVVGARAVDAPQSRVVTFSAEAGPLD